MLHCCLQTPHCPPGSELLEEAEEVFRCFLTWPEPFSSVCRNLLTTLQLEQKAPGKCVCVRVCVVLFLALVFPLWARWKHAVIILAGQTPTRQQEEQNAVAFDPDFISKDMGKFS